MADIDDLFSRNWAFITPELQRTLGETTIFAAGVGLASLIAVVACRTGFGRFILADGDNVERSNLNRQAFFADQIGMNKAEATAALLRNIQPEAEIEVIPTFIDETSYQEPLSRADLVICSLDYASPALFGFMREAQRTNKPVLVPLNLGWGGTVMVFTADSPSLEEFLGLDPEKPATGADVSGNLITQAFAHSPLGLPDYLAPTIEDYVAHGSEWPSEPQLGVAASLTAALIVRAAVALVAGEPLAPVPAVHHVDLRVALDATATSEPSTSATATAPDTVAPVEVPDKLPDAQPDTEPEPDETTPAPVSQQEPQEESAQDNFLVYLDSLQHARRYTALGTITRHRGIVFERRRASGMHIRAVRHDGLLPSQLAALAELRLHQYVLHGLYDAAAVARLGLLSDPSVTKLPPETLHLFAQTDDDIVLAYDCVLPAELPWRHETRFGPLRRMVPYKLSETGRGLFPAEQDLFGPTAFAGLPTIGDVSVMRVREIAHLLRNHAFETPLSSIASVEIVHATLALLADGVQDIDLAVGSIGPRPRKLVERLKTPIYYAPDARVQVTETRPNEDYWLPPTDADGVYWPFIISPVDLRAVRSVLQQLDEALAADPKQVRAALASFIASPAPALQPALLSGESTGSTWVIGTPYSAQAVTPTSEA